MGKKHEPPTFQSAHTLPEKLLFLLNMAKSKISRKINNVRTNTHARKKINRLRSVTQASLMAFAGTVAFVVVLITKYHLTFQSMMNSRTVKTIIPEDFIKNHPTLQRFAGSASNEAEGEDVYIPDPKLSEAENKAAEFKKKFDSRLTNWKPAVPVAATMPKSTGQLSQAISIQQAQAAANRAINPDYTQAYAPPSNLAEQAAKINAEKQAEQNSYTSKISFRSTSKLDPPRLDELDYNRQPESQHFVFHNKLPKSGSSTMNGLLKALAKKNIFNFEKLEPVDIPGDKFDLETPLVKYLKMNLKPPYFLLKHHYFFNFSKYDLPEGIREATYVNVMRNPVDWFASHYYFSRFGWNRKASGRSFDGSDADRDRTVDECVKIRHPECVHPQWKYIEFICGTSPLCQTARLSTVGMQRAVLLAKRNVAFRFHMVGILEQFEDTLKLFEKMLPSFYEGALDLYHTNDVQDTYGGVGFYSFDFRD